MRTNPAWLAGPPRSRARCVVLPRSRSRLSRPRGTVPYLWEPSTYLAQTGVCATEVPGCFRLGVALGCLSGGQSNEVSRCCGASSHVGGCAASRQEVAVRLGDQFVGHNIDSLVMQFGPPTSMFKMNSGQGSYVWQLTAVTDIAADRGYGQA